METSLPVVPVGSVEAFSSEDQEESRWKKRRSSDAHRHGHGHHGSHGHQSGGDRGGGGNLFSEVNNLRKPQCLREEVKTVYADNFFGRINGHAYFEQLTMAVICLNALHIGYDTDYTARFGKPKNLYKGPVLFIVAELFFGVYFSSELFIRFFAFAPSTKWWKDKWFLFDSCLVTLMLAELTIIPSLESAKMPKMSMMRLLRLLRLTRMVRIMRSLPELLLIVKGMVAAVRAVFWTLILLFLITFVWSILFATEYHQGLATDDDVGEDIGAAFGSIGKSFFSLIIMGTILDDITYCTDLIRATNQPMMILAFVIFVVLSSFMMMNMLLGILVTVVANSAEGERRGLAILRFKQALEAGHIGHEDEHGNGFIPEPAFRALQRDRSMGKIFKALGVKDSQVSTLANILYLSESTLQYDVIMEQILRLSPGETISGLDLAFVGKSVLAKRKEVLKRLEAAHQRVQQEAVRRLGYYPQRNPRKCIKASSDFSERSFISAGLGEEPAPPSLSTAASTNASMSGSRRSKLGLHGEPLNSALKRVSADTFLKLDETASHAILEELRRRLGILDMDQEGVPVEMLDDDFKAVLLSAAQSEAPAPDGTPPSQPWVGSLVAALPSDECVRGMVHAAAQEQARKRASQQSSSSGGSAAGSANRAAGGPTGSADFSPQKPGQ
eukprot:TRINITY_DN24283_c0_g1_i1.p1 TRINITY_DN24283_c0_g1~~TRINITY_DN24283_c0_g1_i1.p1  ORF type:complete len:670 (-),score=120.43 TRINITY_DN24283_c0_g1_i1:289-2298(-)